MTNEEAIHKLKHLEDLYCFDCSDQPDTCEGCCVDEAYAKAMVALNTRTPTAPQLIIFEDDEYWHCPNCGYETFEEDRPAYCETCGQAIDWSATVKGEQKMDNIGFEDDELFLLSIEEYEKYKDNIPQWNWWWLRSPGCDDFHVALVFLGGLVDDYGHEVKIMDSVRPALNVDTRGLAVGDRIVKYDFPWIVIDTGLAIAEVPIATHTFDDKNNDYSTSGIRRFLKEWKEGRT